MKKLNPNVKKAKKLVDSILESIKIAKKDGKKSVKIPYDFWYDDEYVGGLVFEHFNREKLPMMVRNDYENGKAYGKYVCIFFYLNPELAI